MLSGRFQHRCGSCAPQYAGPVLISCLSYDFSSFYTRPWLMTPVKHPSSHAIEKIAQWRFPPPIPDSCNNLLRDEEGFPLHHGLSSGLKFGYLGRGVENGKPIV